MRRGRRQRGVALVEFALVAPLLFLLLFGIVEFGWAFLQYLDTRHGAREGARLAAVDYNDPDTADGALVDIVTEICERMDDDADSSVRLTRTSGAVGDRATIEVSRELNTLTGFLDAFLPDGTDFSSTIEFRLEQTASWASMGSATSC